MKFMLSLIMTLFFLNVLTAQINFKRTMTALNPVQDENVIGTSQSIQIHEAFLAKAIAEKNSAHNIYGLLYLYRDYYKKADFAGAAKYILASEKLAKNSGKLEWIGNVKLNRANLTSAVESNYKLAIEQDKEAIKFCAQAQDSLCMGEGYEHLSVRYNAVGNYKMATHYFKFAMELFRKFGTDINFSTAYNNYANLLCNEKKFEMAIVYIDSAKAIAEKNNNIHSVMLFNANIAATYMDMKQYDKALNLINACEPINLKNNWTDNLINNYLCKSICYEQLGKYKEGLNYLNKYNNLKQQYNGEKVQSKITIAEEKYKKEEQQLVLKKKELKLEKSQRAQERYAGISFTLLSFLLIGLLMWRRQSLRNKKEVQENQKSLADLTNLLIQKNALLLEQEQAFHMKTTEVSEPLSRETEAFYNQRILTDSDWASFKESFEKAYPNYISKIRNLHPTITEAEERLFLCIKLNLRTKETASMLGISNDSVKKNRSRLRKRLSLVSEIDLADYIRVF